MNPTTDDPSNFATIPLPTLDTLLTGAVARGNTELARQFRAAMNRHGHVQTEELANSGKLWAHNETITDANNLPIRAVTRFVGDIGATFAPFMSGPITGRIDRDAGKRFETVPLSGNERVIVVRS